jgi:hypothetical protein
MVFSFAGQACWNSALFPLDANKHQDAAEIHQPQRGGKPQPASFHMFSYQPFSSPH